MYTITYAIHRPNEEPIIHDYTFEKLPEFSRARDSFINELVTSYTEFDKTVLKHSRENTEEYFSLLVYPDSTDKAALHNGKIMPEEKIIIVFSI